VKLKLIFAAVALSGQPAPEEQIAKYNNTMIGVTCIDTYIRVDGGPLNSPSGLYFGINYVPTKEHRDNMEREFGWRVVKGTPENHTGCPN
jgi:hypothetical protein